MDKIIIKFLIVAMLVVALVVILLMIVPGIDINVIRLERLCFNETAKDYCNSLNLTLRDVTLDSDPFGISYSFLCYPRLDEHEFYNYRLLRQFRFTAKEIEKCKRK